MGISHMQAQYWEALNRVSTVIGDQGIKDADKIACLQRLLLDFKPYLSTTQYNAVEQAGLKQLARQGKKLQQHKKTSH